jgi:hypothetical protein
MTRFLNRLCTLEFRHPPERSGRCIVSHLRPGQSRAEALAAWRAERPERADVEIARVVWIIRDDGSPGPRERDALPVPVGAAAS